MIPTDVRKRLMFRKKTCNQFVIDDVLRNRLNEHSNYFQPASFSCIVKQAVVDWLAQGKIFRNQRLNALE
jgi:hypothetical protein